MVTAVFPKDATYPLKVYFQDGSWGELSSARDVSEAYEQEIIQDDTFLVDSLGQKFTTREFLCWRDNFVDMWSVVPYLLAGLLCLEFPICYFLIPSREYVADSHIGLIAFLIVPLTLFASLAYAAVCYLRVGAWPLSKEFLVSTGLAVFMIPLTVGRVAEGVNSSFDQSTPIERRTTVIDKLSCLRRNWNFPVRALA